MSVDEGGTLAEAAAAEERRDVVGEFCAYIQERKARRRAAQPLRGRG